MTDAVLKVFDATGEIASDWAVLADDAELPASGKVLLPLERFLAAEGTLPDGFAGDLGIVVDAGEDVTPLAGRLGPVAIIALRFPAFSDGRSYSSARLLRERLGYTGELRAVGDVLIDQIPHMLRCGFNTFQVAHEPTQRRLSSGLPAADAAREVPAYYQPASDATAPVPGRSWARRRA